MIYILAAITLLVGIIIGRQSMVHPISELKEDLYDEIDKVHNSAHERMNIMDEKIHEIYSGISKPNLKLFNKENITLTDNQKD